MHCNQVVPECSFEICGVMLVLDAVSAGCTECSLMFDTAQINWVIVNFMFSPCIFKPVTFIFRLMHLIV